MICIDADAVGIAQPDKVLFDDVSVTVERGDRVAVVGVNGSGKTTLLRILAGSLEPDHGVVRFGRGVDIAVLEQDPQLPAGTVAEVLGDSWEVAAVATSLGVQPLFDRHTTELSGGQAKRVALAKALVGEHDVIILDEPTNHLDLEAIEWLERRLLATSAAVVFVTHDRHVLDRLTTSKGAGKLVELDNGRGYVHRAEANSSAYAVYLDAQAARREREASAEATRRILARRELAWLRRGAPARSSKPKARLRQATEIVTGRPDDRGVRSHDLELNVGMTRLGNDVVELEGVAQCYAPARPLLAPSTDGVPAGDDRPAVCPAGERCDAVFAGVDLVIEPGARLGVVGPNGSGKSTLLDIIAGRTQPVIGTVRRGRTVVTGYADQASDVLHVDRRDRVASDSGGGRGPLQSSRLDPDAIVRELVAGPLRKPDHEDRALLERFWFDTTAQYAPIRMLSGGELRRLLLVMVLATKPNLLVLDEPTNDLDLDTLRALEEFLDDWPGALVVASHDRAFLDRTVDHVLAIGADGQVGRVPGGVAGWLASRQQATSPGSSTSTSISASSTVAGSRATAPAGAPRRSGDGSGPKSPSPYTLGRRLREIEKELARAQRERDRLNAYLADTVDHAELARLGTELADVQATIDDLEERWLQIAEQQER